MTGRGRVAVNIEFLADGAAETPLIRVYGIEIAPLATLEQALRSLADGHREIVDLADLDGFRPINATLALIVGRKSLGIRLPADGRAFQWITTRDAFDDAAELVAALREPPIGGFQWLLGNGGMGWQSSGEVGLVVSMSEQGAW